MQYFIYIYNLLFHISLFLGLLFLGQRIFFFTNNIKIKFIKFKKKKNLY